MEKDIKNTNNKNWDHILKFDEIYDAGLSTSVSETNVKKKIKK